MRQVNKWLLGSLFAANAVLATQAIAQDTNLQVDAQASASISLDKNAIEATVPAAFKAAKQVVIGSFKVGFINYNKATAKSGGGFLSRDKESRVVLRSKLEGLAPEHMQAIVDDIYADFSAQLKNQGYEVLDRSTLTALPAFTSISGSPSPFAVDGVSVVPQAQALYFAPTGQTVVEFNGEANRGAGFSGLASIGSRIGSANATIALQEIAEKNKLAILNVHYIVNFVNAEGTGGYSRQITSVSLNQGLTVMPGSSVSIVTGYQSTFSTKNGSLNLSKAVASNEQFGEFAETTTSLEKAAGVFSMVTGALSGGSSSNTGEYTVNANPQTYQKIATDLLKASNAGFASSMAGLK